MLCGSRILGSIVKGINKIPCYFLFTDESLGLSSFDAYRRKRRELWDIPNDELWRRLYQQTDSAIPSSSEQQRRPKLVFSEDLLQAIAIAQTHDDVSRIVHASTAFIKERMNNGEYRMLKRTAIPFAPLLMKLFHRLRHPDAAFGALMANEDKDLEEFFGNNLQCYQLGMDLFFECRQYQRVLDVWERYQQRRSKWPNLPAFPKSLQVLILASCYKMNTPESFRYAMQFIEKGYEQNSSTITNDQQRSPQPIAFTRKALALASALAVNQNETELAFELLSLIGHNVVDSYAAPRTLKCILLVKLQRWKEIYHLFKRILESDIPAEAYQDREISMEAIKCIENQLNSVNDQELRDKLKRSCVFLRKGGHVVDVSLDTLLCSPVQILPPTTSKELSLLPLGGSKSIPPLPNTGATKVENEDEKNIWETTSVYDDDSSALASLEKFQESERKLRKIHRQREKALNAVGKWIREEGPLEVDDDKSGR